MGSTRQLRACSALLLFLSFQALISDGADTIRKGQSLKDGETLVSLGNRFELGFFSPPSSNNRYVGIWFQQVPDQTVVWVANRENYLANNSGILTINDDGDLLVHDGGEKSIILTSVSAASATILDNGNFILKNEAGEVVWQSFDYPTNTMLAGMEIGIDKKAGRNRTLVSWKILQDPAPGSYSFEADPEGPLLRFFIKRNGSIYWSTGSWNGQMLSLVPEVERNFPQHWSFVGNEEKRTISYALDEAASAPWQFVLDPSGQLQTLYWEEDRGYWRIMWAQPVDGCEEYGACGPNARCNISASVRCNCLQGFSSADVGRLNGPSSSSRCVRQANLTCGNGDGFYPVANIKFPDHSTYEPGVWDCESWCQSNCSCTAYATAYSNGTGGCLFWSGDLIGLRDSPIYINGNGFLAGSLYIRSGGMHKGSTSNSRKISLIVVITSVIFVLSFFLCYLWKRKIKSKGKTKTDEEALELHSSTANDGSYLRETSGPDLPLFSFADVEAATDNFAPSNKLGEGGFGPVYKGKLPEGEEIAVKRLSRKSGQGLVEFKNEVLLISKLQHRNLVRLLGWAVRGEEKILIYEYMPNKSLDTFLFDNDKKMILDWGKRSQIIEGIAQGLLYLHRYSRLRIIHRDLKASNILLDGDMTPKISDFGMARMFDGNQSEENTNRVVGTYGYMSPEYAMRGVFSIKSDVFSFGVLLLEIVVGKRNTSLLRFNGSLNLLGHAWELWKEGRSLELIDPILLVDSSPTSTTEILRYVQVALLCGENSAKDRPTMSDVVHMLTDTTAKISEPKQPAFLIRRAASVVVDTSSSTPTTCSVNLVTLSGVEGR